MLVFVWVAGLTFLRKCFDPALHAQMFFSVLGFDIVVLAFDFRMLYWV